MELTPVSNAAPDAPLSNKTLGTVRALYGIPTLDYPKLRAYLRALPRTRTASGSAGCSPVLRRLLEMTGIRFTVLRELANDRNVTGHKSGNALDVTLDSNITVAAPGASRHPEGTLASVLACAPNAFVGLSYNSIYPVENLRLGRVPDALFESTRTSIHLDSNVNVLEQWLSSATFASERAAFAEAVLGSGPFGSRYVFWHGRVVARSSTSEPATVTAW